MIVVMGEEPAMDITPEDVRSRFAGKTDEQSLAEAYALAHNQAWWVEDNEYDFEVGTEEHAKAVAVTEEWMALMSEYESQIFEILKAEGVEIPDKGRIAVLAPFMERNGFLDGQGWWVEASFFSDDTK